MTELLAALAGGAVLGSGVWLASRSMFSAPVLQRTNHRGLPVPVGAGVVVVLAVVTAVALVEVAAAAGHDLPAGAHASVALGVTMALGFGLLGLFDDLAAHGEDKGFRGHVRAMASGRLTTGAVKLVGGGLVALAVVGQAGSTSVAGLFIGGALVALAANLGNLFDRAPGRVLKVTVLATGVLVAALPATARPALVGPLLIVGAGLGLLPFDLRESLMLGDAGANVLGAALGLGVVLTTGLAVELGVVVVLLALNAASEVVSFSRVIDRVAPLRWLDRLGRPVGPGPAGGSTAGP